MSNEFTVLLGKINDATNLIAERIRALIAKHADADAELKASLEGIATNLDVLGTNPSDPTPPLPPE